MCKIGFMENYKKLHNRIIDISYSEKLSHISSCLTTLPILYSIYNNKKKDDIVILSNGHAGLAQYVCMEYFENNDAIELFHKYGVHPEKNKQDNIACSTGSLGLGLLIAVGHALANKNRNVWCVISDGECCEGSVWEALYYLSKNPINNLFINVNANGFSAYDTVDIKKLTNILSAFNIKNLEINDTSYIFDEFPFLKQKGIESHYCKISTNEILDDLLYPN